MRRAQQGGTGEDERQEAEELIYIDGESLTFDDVLAVAREGVGAALSAEARQRVLAAAELVAEITSNGRIVYGLNTGFGKLYDVVIPAGDLGRLQLNLVRSHSVGVGKPLSDEVVRASILLRANALAKGNSGISAATLDALLAMLNADVLPVVPSQGSVGASGDLAPSAHIALALIGEGEAFYRGQRMPARLALQEAGLTPARLGPKEGLALLNGTSTMTGIGALVLADAAVLAKAADIAAALTFEAANADPNVLDPRAHRLRPHPGQMESAANMRAMLADSSIYDHQPCATQDPYSLRCSPQVHGAARDALGYARQVVETEMNSANDNPLVFPEDGDVICAGNFHGEPVAMAMDFTGIALAELGSISERRIDRLMSGTFAGLPRFLTQKEGLNSGLMLTQYTAAALVSENKVLSSPASVDSIPTSAGQEDHVSMGTIAARKAQNILANARRVIAIELLAAAQALDLRGRVRMGAGTSVAYEAVRRQASLLEEDRSLSPDIETVAAALASGELVGEVEESVDLE
ncbi:MAG: histidine ammonia-lyase [Chloroflexota bacterium]